MKVTLVVADGPHKGKEIPVRLPQFIIGRDPQCQLRPASSMISRRHCAILTKQGKVYLRDFGSTNGTVVNDKRVDGEIEVRHNDRITIDPLAFELRIEAGAAANPKTKAAAEPVEDDSIAALLLEMGEEAATGSALSDSGVPAGSTVHQMQALENPDGSAPEEKSAATTKAEQVKADQANTSNAAKLLLEKYARRRRP